MRISDWSSDVCSSDLKGMLNNCSSGRTPWNSYLTCEETMDNYLDPAQPETNYGWVVEIDPLRELAQPTKRTAMGRFNHEIFAYMANADRAAPFNMANDTTPGYMHKFFPDRAYSQTNGPANTALLYYATPTAAGSTGDAT